MFHSLGLSGRPAADLEEEEMISSFRSELCFLSNFYSMDIKYEGVVYGSAEHAFQAAKCVKESDKEKILNARSPKTAKIIGRFVQIRPDWEAEKCNIMEKIVRVKFRKPVMKRLLQNTGDVELVEHNYWHDTFWGICTCKRHEHTGENKLGKILMKIRDEIGPVKKKFKK